MRAGAVGEFPHLTDLDCVEEEIRVPLVHDPAPE